VAFPANRSAGPVPALLLSDALYCAGMAAKQDAAK
jgi:hypothetical protein